MNVVFDVDGVLIDTREQVHEAYARCGVTMPPEAFTKSWTEWLPDLAGGVFAATRIHKRKTQVYLQLLDEMPPKVLPAGRMLREYRGAGLDMHAITSASEESVCQALVRAGLGFVPVLGFELDRKSKNTILQEKFVKPGVYVDDNGSFRVTASGWRFVHYRGQSYTTLVNDIWNAGARIKIEVE